MNCAKNGFGADLRAVLMDGSTRHCPNQMSNNYGRVWWVLCQRNSITGWVCDVKGQKSHLKRSMDRTPFRVWIDNASKAPANKCFRQADLRLPQARFWPASSTIRPEPSSTISFVTQRLHRLDQRRSIRWSPSCQHCDSKQQQRRSYKRGWVGRLQTE